MPFSAAMPYISSYIAARWYADEMMRYISTICWHYIVHFQYFSFLLFLFLLHTTYFSILLPCRPSAMPFRYIFSFIFVMMRYMLSRLSIRDAAFLILIFSAFSMMSIRPPSPYGHAEMRDIFVMIFFFNIVFRHHARLFRLHAIPPILTAFFSCQRYGYSFRFLLMNDIHIAAGFHARYDRWAFSFSSYYFHSSCWSFLSSFWYLYDRHWYDVFLLWDCRLRDIHTPAATTLLLAARLFFSFSLSFLFHFIEIYSSFSFLAFHAILPCFWDRYWWYTREDIIDIFLYDIICFAFFSLCLPRHFAFIIR